MDSNDGTNLNVSSLNAQYEYVQLKFPLIAKFSLGYQTKSAYSSALN